MTFDGWWESYVGGDKAYKHAKIICKDAWDAARSSEADSEAVELLRLWAKRLEYSDPHGDYPKVAAVLRRFDTEERK